MEVRRVAEALLRSQKSPIPAYLTPSISRWQSCTRIASITYSNNRTFASSSRQYAFRPVVTSSKPKSEPLKDGKPAAEVTVDELSDQLNWLQAGIGGNSTSRFKSSTAQDQKKSTPPTEEEAAFNGGHSAMDLLSSFNQMKQNPSPRSSSGNIWDTMASPPSSKQTPYLSMDDMAAEMEPPLRSRQPIRLTFVAGRTVEIGANMDVARGFTLLNSSCARNKVAKDARKQMFHERGGLKRKRLRRERWRKQFLDGFRATIARVTELKQQGW